MPSQNIGNGYEQRYSSDRPLSVYVCNSTGATMRTGAKMNGVFETLVKASKLSGRWVEIVLPCMKIFKKQDSDPIGGALCFLGLR